MRGPARPVTGLRPLRLSLGNAPPFDVPARFIALGGVSLATACVLIAVWAGPLVQPAGWADAQALGLTHVLALGFVTAIMLGVLAQMLPVIFGAPPPRAIAARVLWWCFLASTAAFATVLISGRDDLAPFGGIALTVTIIGVVAYAALVMRRATRRSIVALFLIGALCCLVAVACMGGVLALSMRTGLIHDPATLLAPKVLLAVGGWLGLVLVGVSYQIVPLFSVSAARARYAPAVLWLLSAGVVLGVAALVANAAPPVRAAALAPYVAGAVLYALDVARLVRARRAAAVGITQAGQLGAAAVFVIGSAAGLPAMAGLQPWPLIAVTTALLGWAPLAICANGARIIPFLAWTRAGVPGAAPLAADSIPNAAAAGLLTGLGAGWLLIEAGIMAGAAACVRAGALLVLAAAMTFATLLFFAVRGRFGWRRVHA